ncbi:MAG: sugar phosphate nucleotidyltransferase [Actinomycetota bacterium]|nr:sugar phosphate nucleotidyltransferase [Actinomycetota bacterium]
MRSGPDVLVMVLAGGAGSRLEPLTDHRAKPALPFGGMYRLIDITLSNVAHSGFDDVWVIEQYLPHALNDHLANGRPWDLDRTHGGLQILPPFEGERQDGFAGGNADAIAKQLPFLRDFAPDVVVVVSADHVYRLDLAEVVSSHLDRRPELTIVTTERAAGDDPSRFAWVSVGDDGTVTDFQYKPDDPKGTAICAEVFVFDGLSLLRRLGHLVVDADDDSGEADGGQPLGDYGERLLPELVDDGAALAFTMQGYWRDVGTIGAYHAAHMDLLGDDPVITLDDPSWPMLTGSITGGPAIVGASARVVNSLLSPGSRVAGEVVDSVLGRNVVIEDGARVRGSVVLDDAIIRSGVTVERSIVDVGVELSHLSGRSITETADEDSGIRVYTTD